MAENKEAPEPEAGSTIVPTSFTTELTLPPGGTANLQVTTDVDLALQGMAAQATGPALIRIRIRDCPDPGLPIIRIPGENFQQYVQQEFPQHLAARAGEELTTWEQNNHALLQSAVSGDDEAFFELLARDPRVLTSELTLRRVVTWQTEIDHYDRFYRFKGSRIYVSGEAVHEAQGRAEDARSKLKLFGQAQVRAYDQRGKRPLPPPGWVRGVYGGLLCLLQGLRTAYKQWLKAVTRDEEREAALSVFLTDLAALHGASPFLPYIATAAQLITDAAILERAALKEERLGSTLVTLAGGQDVTPSDTARAITAAAFEVSDGTVEHLCAKLAPIPLPPTLDECVFLIGRPTFDLFVDFPEIEPLRAQLARLK